MPLHARIIHQFQRHVHHYDEFIPISLPTTDNLKGPLPLRLCPPALVDQDEGVSLQLFLCSLEETDKNK